MTDREKLCLLIKEGGPCPADLNPFEEEKCAICKYQDDRDCDISRLADFLITNGVAVQQWIPVSERLPEEDGYYLCYVRSCLFQDRRYLNILKCDKYGFSDGAIYTDNVTHWMPPPEPPKEE